MSDSPLFSILIANYNNGRYLMQAIDSVKSQSYTNWEIILVDDASTDNSFTLYEQLRDDPRIHIFFNESNKGCGYTKRRCAELANGTICGYLDPDDVLLPDSLRAHFVAHSNKPDTSCVFSRSYLCDECLNIMGKTRLLYLAPGCSYLTNRDYTVEHFASFKKDCYFKTEGISSDIKAAVDQDLYFKLEEIAPVFVLDEFTYKYRIHSQSVSNSKLNEATYWNLVVRHRACLRRGLNPSDYPVKDFLKYLINTFNEGADKTRLSSSYRLGKFLLTPLKWFKK